MNSWSIKSSSTRLLRAKTCGAFVGISNRITSGKAYPICRETAPSHTTCHLDAAGVDAACADIIGQVSASDLVVLGKFGKLEAMREGLAGAFEVAIEAGKPVLTTVSEKHRCAWESFAPEAICLVADEAALQAWWKRVAGRTAEL